MTPTPSAPRTTTLLGIVLGSAFLLTPTWAAGQCAGNQDCKGGRVCRDGRCQNPACEKDTDCSGDLICGEEGVCMTQADGTGAVPVRPAPTAPAPGTEIPSPPLPAAAPVQPTSASESPGSDVPPVPVPVAPATQAPAYPPAPTQTDSAPPSWSYRVPETARRSPPLFISGVVAAVAGGVAAVIGIPLAVTASETLNVCYQSRCEAVDVTDATQRDAGIGLAIGGGVVLVGGMVMALVGGQLVEVQPVTAAPVSAIPEVLVYPTGGAARWWF